MVALDALRSDAQSGSDRASFIGDGTEMARRYLVAPK